MIAVAWMDNQILRGLECKRPDKSVLLGESFSEKIPIWDSTGERIWAVVSLRQCIESLAS